MERASGREQPVFVESSGSIVDMMVRQSAVPIAISWSERDFRKLSLVTCLDHPRPAAEGSSEPKFKAGLVAAIQAVIVHTTKPPDC